MTQEIEYTYKLYRDNQQQLVVTVDPLVKDIEVSIEKMMNMDVEELSDDNKHLFEMKILGLRTIHQFLGALQQENYLKEYKAGMTNDLKGKTNIDVNERLDAFTQGSTVH
jgi:hypothetical protein